MNVKQSDLANTYSLTDGLLETSARRVTQYVYNGDYGSNKVKFGAYYGGSSKRNIKNVDLKNNRKTLGVQVLSSITKLIVSKM